MIPEGWLNNVIQGDCLENRNFIGFELEIEIRRDRQEKNRSRESATKIVLI